MRKVASGMRRPAPWPQAMSYLHCPTCHRAYNVAARATCPYCPVAATTVDATEDIVVAAEQLARAMGRASETERDAAAARMERLALPAPGAQPATFHPATLQSIRAALRPPAPLPRPQPLFASIAMAVLTRLEARPRLHAGLLRAANAVRRVRALAA